MTKYTFNDRNYFYQVFETANKLPFILLSQKENAQDGLFKVYFLHKYSIKFAMEDFIKYEENYNNRKNAMQQL